MKNGDKPLSRSDIKKSAILRAAKKVFLNHGFSNSSVDDIAILANVSKKTVYHHFVNKEALFRAMLSNHWTSLFTKKGGLFNEKKSLTENLANFAKLFFNFLYDQNTIDLFRVLISESNRFPNLLETMLVDNKAPFTRALIEFLKERNKAGELNIKNTERAASYFMGMLKENHFWPMMLGFIQTKKPKNKKAIISESIAIFIKFYAN